MVAQSISFWLAISSFVITATMMHPSLASLLVLVINAGLLIAIRYTAKWETRKNTNVRPESK